MKHSCVWEINDGAHHWVIGADCAKAIEVWRKAVQDTGEEPAPLEAIVIKEIPADMVFEINFDGTKVEHKASDWYAIYCGTGHNYLACSEW